MPLAGHGRRPTALRRRAGRPQLKRDPLGRGMRLTRPLNLVLLVVFSGPISTRRALGQLRVGVLTPAHWVREEMRQQGELFSGPWDSLATTWVVPGPPDSVAALHVALVETGVRSIVPRGRQVESCRDYGLLVQGASPADRRAVFFIGDMREPRAFRFERLNGGASLRLRLEGFDCLTYELVAAGKAPLLRRYQIDVRAETVTVQVVEN